MLQKIQAQLKAPKGNYNSFGKYKYRSCEDIVEAVKPILTLELEDIPGLLVMALQGLGSLQRLFGHTSRLKQP